MPKRLPFPSSELALDIYFQFTIKHINDNAARLQIDTIRLGLLNSYLTDWNSVFAKSRNVDKRTKTITQKKNNLRDVMITVMREMYKNIPDLLFTTEDRVVFNLPKKKENRSAPPVPDTIPIITVDVGRRLQHSIKFYNEGSSKAKPYLCRGCQIWYKMGTSPTDVSEMQYMATASKSPYLHVFKGEVGGQMVHYWARWENTAGKTGSWSQIAMATIAG